MSSRVDALLATFKHGQKAAIRTQAELRLEREDKLAKAAQGAQAGRGRGGKAAAGRGGRGSGKASTSAVSGDAAGSAASGAAAGAPTDWKQRSRQQQQQHALPVGVKIKAVVDFLRACGEPQQSQAIAAATGYDPYGDAGLAAALATNNKVTVQDDGLYAYRPEVANVRSKQEVLEYMRRREKQAEGYAALGELQDAYPGVRQDLEALKKEGLVVSLPAADVARKEVYYPVDLRLQLKADQDLQELWLSVGDQLPEEEEELHAELKKIGLKPAPRQVVERREAREKKKKARKVRRLMRVTNVHLKHLLEGDEPVNIETA